MTSSSIPEFRLIHHHSQAAVLIKVLLFTRPRKDPPITSRAKLQATETGLDLLPLYMDPGIQYNGTARRSPSLGMGRRTI